MRVEHIEGRSQMPVRWDLERIKNWESKFGEILLESEITKDSVLERHCT